MSIEYEKRVIALAGIAQVAWLVDRLAQTGMVPQDNMDASLRSVFIQNPSSITEVFEGTKGIRRGLQVLHGMLDSPGQDEDRTSVLKYSLAIVQLERKLSQRPDMLREIGARVARIDEARMLGSEQPGSIDPEIVAQLAQVYEATLSQIHPRIKISGKPRFLDAEVNAHRIRALLLAGVRSAVLWHQVGGARWQLVFARGRMKLAIRHLDQENR